MTRTISRRIPAALAAVVVLPALAAAGTITGTATYEGKVPRLRPISMDADPSCAEKHDGPVANELLVLGDGNTMANIFVQISSGLPDKDWPTPDETAVIDQRGCQYHPHVLAVQVNQKVRILNSDQLMHNVHALPEVNSEFNVAMPPTRTETIETFSKAEGMFRIKCDVHPWMGAYVAVRPHPFFDVTEKDGRFTITDVPAGTYELSAWHEKLGMQTKEVTVPADGSVTVDFAFSPPKR